MPPSKRGSARDARTSSKKAKTTKEQAGQPKPAIPDNAPLAILLDALSNAHNQTLHPHGNVVHWFRSDLRLTDNRALHAASLKAQENCGSLIALYVISPQVRLLWSQSYNCQDWRFHGTATSRVDFILRTLRILQRDLDELDIPLHIQAVEPRKQIPSKIMDLMKKWKATDVFANIEYEVDELGRDAKFIEKAHKSNVQVTYCHDQCIVAPGAIASKVWLCKEISFLTIDWKSYVCVHALVAEVDVKNP
jgi:DNA photolyase